MSEMTSALNDKRGAPRVSGVGHEVPEEDNFNNSHILIKKPCFEYQPSYPLSSFTRFTRKSHFAYAADAPSPSAFG